MYVRLLHGIVGSHAQVDRDNIGLNIGEMVGRTRKVDRFSVHGKYVTRNIIAISHCLQSGGIRGQNRAKLGMAILTWHRIDWRNGEVVDPDDLLVVRPASPLVNSVKNEGPELLEDLSLFGQ